MEITSNGGSEFARLAGKFRKAGKDGAAIRRRLTGTIQTELKTVVEDIRHEVLSLTVTGERGGSRATRTRERFRLAHRKRLQRGGHGLRASVARSVKSRVSYTGRKIGARIYIDPSGMPQSQRTLPVHLNDERGWRHPTWGHRDRWVRQEGGPYFDKPIERRRDHLREAVGRAVHDVMMELK